MKGRTTAALFDTQPLWLEGCERVLEGLDITIIAKTTSSKAVLESVRSLQPSLLVLDLEGVGDPGERAAFLDSCLAASPRMRAIVLSSDSDPASIEDALAAGASAYVLKSAHPADLASAIRQAFNSSVFFASTPRTHRPTEGRASRSDAPNLTKREAEILRLAAEGKSNSELARALWVTEQTVKFHLSNVYRKLKVSNRTEAALWAHQSGLLHDRERLVEATPVAAAQR